jgi:hypothetical protein
MRFRALPVKKLSPRPISVLVAQELFGGIHYEF